MTFANLPEEKLQITAFFAAKHVRGHVQSVQDFVPKPTRMASIGKTIAPNKGPVNWSNG